MNLKKRKTQDGVALEFYKLPSVLQHERRMVSFPMPCGKREGKQHGFFGCEAAIALTRTLLPTKMMFWVGFERSTSGIESICI